MARCSRRAMRPAAVMGAFYRAMLDALLRSEWRDPSAARRPVEARRSSGWCCATASMTARSQHGLAGCMSSGPGSPGSPRRSRSPTTGGAVVLYEAAPHAGGRCRSFFDAELGVRIDNGNHLLLVRQSGGARLCRADRRARHVRAAGGGGDPVCRPRRPASAGRCGRRAAPCRGGCFVRRGGCRERERATISPRCALRRAGPGDTVAAVLRSATRRCFAGCGSRSPSRRSNTARRAGLGRAVLAHPRRDARARRGRVPAAAGARRAVGKPRRSGARTTCRARARRSASAPG